jgi:hypothetical protein
LPTGAAEVTCPLGVYVTFTLHALPLASLQGESFETSAASAARASSRSKGFVLEVGFTDALADADATGADGASALAATGALVVAARGGASPEDAGADPVASSPDGADGGCS